MHFLQNGHARKLRHPLLDIFSDEWKQIFRNKPTTISYLPIIEIEPAVDDAYLETMVAYHQLIIHKTQLGANSW